MPASCPAERHKITAFLEVESARNDVKVLYNFLVEKNDGNKVFIDKIDIFKILYVDVPLLQTALLAHEKAFVAERLRLVCTAIFYQNRYKTTFDFGNLKSILQTVENEK